MKVKVIEEAGHNSALLGLSLNFNSNIEKMPKTLKGLSKQPRDSHSKVMRMMQVWIDITAPRYFYQQFDQYKVSTVSSSESTMNTLWKRDLTQDDFEYNIPKPLILRLNMVLRSVRKDKSQLHKLKVILPEGFLQRRIILLNYTVIKNMIADRHNHKLVEWQYFCENIVDQLEYPELLPEFKEKR